MAKTRAVENELMEFASLTARIDALGKIPQETFIEQAATQDSPSFFRGDDKAARGVACERFP